MTRRLVVEADGGSRGNPGPAGYGAVVRDATTGEVLAEVSESIGRATNNVAEYSGLIAGLRAAAAIARGADVDQVRSRVDRDRTRLDAGQVSSPRELENLQSEIASLARRQSDLEEIVLDVMERQEAAELRHKTLTQEEGALARQRDEVGARRDAALAEIGEQEEKAGSLRAGVAADVPGDLLDLYGKLRAQHGVGAAALRRGRCEGCHLSLNTVDLARIRAAPPDEVLRCEECRRILVRTPESGL